MLYLQPGSEGVCIGVHRGILLEQSDFFRWLFHGNAASARNGVLCMPKDSAEVVRYFITWLYSKKLATRAEGRGNENIEVEIPIASLFAFHHFALAKQIPRLQCDIINELAVRSLSTVPKAEHVTLAYQEPENKLLRTFLVDWYCWTHPVQGMLESTLSAWRQDCPKPFFVDVSIRTAQHPKRESNAPYVKRRCLYHNHKKDETCPSGKRKKRKAEAEVEAGKG